MQFFLSQNALLFLTVSPANIENGCLKRPPPNQTKLFATNRMKCSIHNGGNLVGNVFFQFSFVTFGYLCETAFSMRSICYQTFQNRNENVISKKATPTYRFFGGVTAIKNEVTLARNLFRIGVLEKCECGFQICMDFLVCFCFCSLFLLQNKKQTRTFHQLKSKTQQINFLQ